MTGTGGIDTSVSIRTSLVHGDVHGDAPGDVHGDVQVSLVERIVEQMAICHKAQCIDLGLISTQGLLLHVDYPVSLPTLQS